MQTTGKKYLLAIAINEYQHLTPLKNCVKDAEDIIGVLVNRYQFEEDCIIRLYDKEASQEKIILAFRKLAQAIKPEDSLLVYFAGHGFYEKVFDEGHWIPVGGKLNNSGTFISNSRILNFVRAIKSLHTLMLVDSCFSGSIVLNRKVGMDRLAEIPSRWVITSGRNEPVQDGSPGTNSPFAREVLYFLKRNKDAKRFASDLAQYVKVAIGNNEDQIPLGGPLKAVGDKGGEFMFELRKNDTIAWDAARNKNTIYAYKTFIAEFPNSTWVDSARSNLHALKDQTAFKIANREKSIPAYNTYLKKYPDGDFVDQAEAAIHKLKDEKAWREALYQNDSDAYLSYIRLFPEGSWRSEAKVKLNVIKRQLEIKEEEVLWKKTQEVGTAEAYSTYIDKYPSGLFIDQAVERLSLGQQEEKLSDSGTKRIVKKQRTTKNLENDSLTQVLTRFDVLFGLGGLLVILLAILFYMNIRGNDPEEKKEEFLKEYDSRNANTETLEDQILWTIWAVDSIKADDFLKDILKDTLQNLEANLEKLNKEKNKILENISIEKRLYDSHDTQAKDYRELEMEEDAIREEKNRAAAEGNILELCEKINNDFRICQDFIQFRKVYPRSGTIEDSEGPSNSLSKVTEMELPDGDESESELSALEKYLNENFDSHRDEIDGMIIVKKGKKWGVINTEVSSDLGDFNLIVNPRSKFAFDEVFDYHNGFVAAKRGGGWGYIDRNGNSIYKHSLNPFPFKKIEEKFGLTCEGYGKVEIDGNKFFVKRLSNHKGELVSDRENGSCPVDFSDEFWKKYHYVGDLKEGMVFVYVGDKYGLVDTNRKNSDGTYKEVVSPTGPYAYDFYFNFHNGLAAVKRDGGWGYVDEFAQPIYKDAGNPFPFQDIEEKFGRTCPGYGKVKIEDKRFFLKRVSNKEGVLVTDKEDGSCPEE